MNKAALLLLLLLPVTLLAAKRPEIIITVRHVQRAEYEPKVKNYYIYANDYPRHCYVRLSANAVQIFDQGRLRSFKIKTFEGTVMSFYHQTYWEYRLMDAAGAKYNLIVIVSHRKQQSRFEASLLTDRSNGILSKDKVFGYYSAKYRVN